MPTLEHLDVRALRAVVTTYRDAVAAHPDVQIGSYPRFGESEFQVILTIEGKRAESVDTACRQLAAALGDSVVNVEGPTP